MSTVLAATGGWPTLFQEPHAQGGNHKPPFRGSIGIHNPSTSRCFQGLSSSHREK